MKNRLKELREEQGLSLRELSDATGMANSTLSQYETGRREPKLKTWEKLADYFYVSVPYLQGYIDDRIGITDLNYAEQEAYDRITYMLSQEYPQDRSKFNWSKIGQLLINADLTEE